MNDGRLTIAGLRAHGDASALLSVTGDGPTQLLSYRQLAARALGVADALDAAGLVAGERVALLSHRRGANEAVGLCGILAAGGVVVPLDAGAPKLRLQRQFNDSGCRGWVHDDSANEVVTAIAGASLRIELDTEGLVLASVGDPVSGAAADTQLACVLHTSGSSGRPKAVPMSWQGIDAFLQWMTTLLTLSPSDRVLRVAELVFDLAWFDHLATFRAGATLCALSRRQLAAGRSLAAAIDALAPSIIYGVPSMFIKLTAASDAPLSSSLRAICFAGEVFPRRQLATFAERVPHAALYNLYGPTETNVCCYHALTAADRSGNSEIPIGVACPYAQCRIVTKDGRTIRGQGLGELVVSGPTAFNGEVSTGDRIQRAANGLFYFRGRLDRMVKLRGYRVDPCEVETTLATHPAVQRAAVTIGQHPRLGKRLCAWVVLARPLDNAARALRQHLAAQLPGYMVPDTVKLLAKLPQTTTGKIDYAALDT